MGVPGIRLLRWRNLYPPRLARFRLRASLALIAVVALVIGPWTSAHRSESLRRARELRSRSLAATILHKYEWIVPWQSIEVIDGERATYVFVQSVGGRPPMPHTLIVPHPREEPVLLLLHDYGLRSGDSSRLLIDRNDLRILDLMEAE